MIHYMDRWSSLMDLVYTFRLRKKWVDWVVLHRGLNKWCDGPMLTLMDSRSGLMHEFYWCTHATRWVVCLFVHMESSGMMICYCYISPQGLAWFDIYTYGFWWVYDHSTPLNFSRLWTISLVLLLFVVNCVVTMDSLHFLAFPCAGKLTFRGSAISRWESNGG